MNTTKTLLVALVLTVFINAVVSKPLFSFFDPEPSPESRDDDAQATTDLIRLSEEESSSLIRYDTVVPVLKVVLTPIGRMLQPMIEQWLVDRFGAYIDTIGRTMESFARFATETVSFQTGDTYYTKSDLIDGHGYNSLIINLPSGRTLTVLTHKSNRRLNILDEFPQLSEALNEVRKLQ
ncbi:uncharacterized protein LOC129749568 [Uranotaenia lowii]|uniref:uncharacterized protein LOC129749568 n=1 Tax=Uranotaenia lowii TaxID=190385 RepID=UPI002479A6A4|nr:uncharacterized protein LOC129749568 [Uranotaenia lowii]